MKNITYIFLVFAFFCFTATFAFSPAARPEKIALPDTTQVNELNRTGFTYWNSNPAKTEFYGKEALALATQINYTAGAAEARRVIGISYWARGKYENALRILLQALDLYKSLNHLPGQASVYTNLGLVFDEQGEYEKALEHHQLSMHMLEKSGNNIRLATGYNNIGAVYHKMKQYPKAEEYYTRALQIRRSVVDEFGIAESLNNIGIVYQDKKEYSKALQHFKESLSIKEKMNDYNGLAMTWSNIGEVYSQQGKYEQATIYFDKALQLSRQYRFIKWEVEVYERLKKMWESRGDYKRALHYYQKQISLQDSLLNSEKIRLLTEMETQYRSTKQKQEIDLQKQRIDMLIKDRKMEAVYRVTLVLFILGVLIVGGLVLRMQRIRIRKNRELLETRQALIQAQLENKLMKEKELQRALEIKSQELASYSMNLLQKNEMIEELRDNIEQLKKTPSEQLPQQLKNMRRLLDNSLHIDKEWEEFKLHFAQVHPSLFRNLKERFPELSSNDLKLCALIKLNLNLKEAASVLGIAPESVKSARYRLRKKFNLSHEENLGEFIRSMDEENERTMLSA